ncbi:Regulatory-associated protein of TOR 1 [Sesamum angolense]|uniref:Regulatory-associated protein of TOR 1 n=1 Tax=Sesamum angolense TaxID=2727404 RepID=A0AAE2BP21_9LAMI|nr:Regulatory-associated protein of TOR 1 [Sesamum angolense]
MPGLMHGSPLSDDSSQHSDSGALNDSGGNGVLNHSRRRPLDTALYSQCVLAMCTLGKDPSPRVSNLGRQLLSIIGVEQVFAKSIKSSGLSARLGESTTTASTSLTGLARSSSWFELNGGGHLPLTFRTPPVSPPRASYLTGMRRVYSLEFRPHLINSPDSGLADPLLGSAGPCGVSERSLLPQSTIYNWSSGHFSKPLLTPVDDSEDIIARREEREKVALDHIVKCQHSSVSKLHNQIASWDTKFETGTKTALLQPFSPVVIASDENERIRVSKLCLVNELDENLLLVASNDGNIRIWKDYTAKGQQKLVTAFASIQGHRPGVRSVNAVVDWQQQSDVLYVTALLSFVFSFQFASGEISSIMAWDLDKEQLAVSQVQGGQFAAGFVDGYVRLYDIRTPEKLVGSTRPHTQRVERVVGIGFLPGLEPAKIVSASQAGNIQFLDMRCAKGTYLTIDAHRGSLTALAVHRHAPLIASGSAKQLIKVFNLEGDQLGTIRYYPTFMAQKIGSVSCLTFHSYQVLLAAGAADACVSIYADEISPQR